MKRKIQVLMLVPGEEPCPTVMCASEFSLRKAVNLGSEHQHKAACRRVENNICVIFNRMRSHAGFAPNRRIADDILCGVIYIAGIDKDGRLRTLTDDELQKYSVIYQTPESYTYEEAQSANLTYTYNVQVRGMESRDLKLIYG